MVNKYFLDCIQQGLYLWGMGKGDMALNNWLYSTRYDRFTKPKGQNICPSLLKYYKPVNDVNQYLSIRLRTSIYLSGYTLVAFEQACREHSYKFNRRTLNGLIRSDRGDFRLSFFAIAYGILGIDLDDVLREYYTTGEGAKKVP